MSSSSASASSIPASGSSVTSRPATFDAGERSRVSVLLSAIPAVLVALSFRPVEIGLSFDGFPLLTVEWLSTPLEISFLDLT